MSSYAFGNEYGTDQINIDPYNNTQHYLNNTNMIKNREMRILKKFEEYSPKYNTISSVDSEPYYLPSINKINKKNKDVNEISKVNISDIKFLHNEMENLEQKNNMLLIFIFFLVFIVIIQYSTINNNNMPFRVMLIPAASTAASGTYAVSAN